MLKADQRSEESFFLLRTKLISPCPVAKVYDVFRIRILPLSSGGQLIAVAITCIIWQVSRTNLVKISKSGISPWNKNLGELFLM